MARGSDRILGYGCTAIDVEPLAPPLTCTAGAAHVHQGIDFDLAYGTRVYAGRPGLVVAVGGAGPDRHDYGPNYVRIWLDEGHDTLMGYSGDLGGPAVSAQLSAPEGVVAGPRGELYIADTGNDRVRMVNASGLIVSVAGGGWGVMRPTRWLGSRPSPPRSVLPSTEAAGC